ncbi:MAG: class I SAM-dependent methyltransferase [Nitrospinae bacterium]|nr:class I SAM-dependent methyltransferase [Nitrospinota bacterium]
MTDTPWYRPFFTGLALDFWRGLDDPAATAREVRFLIDELAPPPGGRLLDLPCGYGRHAVALAEAGFHVVGVDLAEPFIREGKRRGELSKVSGRLHLTVGDMADLPVEGPFDGAFCMGNSFSYLPPSRQSRFVKGIADLLNPGARLVVETGMVCESILPLLTERPWMASGDVRLMMTNRYDAPQGRLETEWTFVRGREEEVRHSTHWVVSAAEAIRELAGAGLTVTGVYGGLDRSPYRVAAPYLYLTAVKEG